MDHAIHPPERESGTNRRKGSSSLRPLILLNMVLLIVLGGVTFSSSSEAQQRARGDYTMVAGDVRGTNAGAVYIVDVRNQEMVVVAYNNSEHRLDGVAYRHLGRDFEAMRGQQGQRR